MTRTQLLALTEAKFAFLVVAIPFVGGALLTFPWALRAALRHYSKEIVG